MTAALALLAVALAAVAVRAARRRGYAQGRVDGTLAAAQAAAAATCHADTERRRAVAERDDARAWLDIVLARARPTPGTHDDDTDGFHRIHAAGTGTDGDPT